MHIHMYIYTHRYRYGAFLLHIVFVTSISDGVGRCIAMKAGIPVEPP